MKRDRTLRALLLVAAMFIILGAGNIVFGRSRLDHYSNLLSNATAELATSELQYKAGVQGDVLNIDQQTVFVNRLRTRVSFYSFVVLGGQCFLAAAGVCLLGALVRLRYVDSQPELSDPNIGP